MTELFVASASLDDCSCVSIEGVGEEVGESRTPSTARQEYKSRCSAENHAGR